MAQVIGYHKMHTANCGCGAVLQYTTSEIKYNSAGIGTIRCPACGGFPVVDDNYLMARFPRPLRQLDPYC